MGNEIHSETDTVRVSDIVEVYEEEQKNGNKKEKVIIEEKIELKTEEDILKGSCRKKDHNLQSHMLHGKDEDQIIIDERCGKASDYILMIDGYEIGMFSSKDVVVKNFYQKWIHGDGDVVEIVMLVT